MTVRRQVFVRLISPTGEAVTEFGTEGRATPGHYVATMVSPAGGIAAVEVGMRGAAVHRWRRLPDG